MSFDRQGELIGATFNALNKGIFPSTTNRPSLTPPDVISPWKANTQYKVHQRMFYQGQIYRCIKSHRSKRRGIPDLKASLWQLETQPTLATTTKPSIEDNISKWKSYKWYSIDDQGEIYPCRQAHTSLSDWMPPVVPTLWLQV